MEGLRDDKPYIPLFIILKSIPKLGIRQSEQKQHMIQEAGFMTSCNPPVHSRGLFLLKFGMKNKCAA
jgi:hypothetical protein